MTFDEARHAKQVRLIDTESKQIVPLPVPLFRPLQRVTGSFEEVMAQAHSQDWQDQYIEVIVQLDDVVAGASDTIRQAFAERGGDVLVVQTQAETSSISDPISTDEWLNRSPLDIFEAYYRDRFPEGDDLPELMRTFQELMALAEKADEA